MNKNGLVYVGRTEPMTCISGFTFRKYRKSFPAVSSRAVISDLDVIVNSCKVIRTSIMCMIEGFEIQNTDVPSCKLQHNIRVQGQKVCNDKKKNEKMSAKSS